LTLKEAAGGRLVMPHLAKINADQPDKVVRSVITAYTSSVDQCDDDPFIAAWGERVYDGMIAANWLPHGTKVRIPALFGDKVFTVADRMNPRYGYGRIDIWMSGPRADAVKFGVQRADLEIFYPEKTLAIAK
jgi:3D (Asp-Asp-Asp) domain-containing protein